MTTMEKPRLQVTVQVSCRRDATPDQLAALSGWLFSHTAGVLATNFASLTTKPHVLVELVSPDPLRDIRDALSGCPPEFKVHESMEVL